MIGQVTPLGDWDRPRGDEKAVVLLFDEETGRVSGATNVTPQLAVLMLHIASRLIIDHQRQRRAQQRLNRRSTDV